MSVLLLEETTPTMHTCREMRSLMVRHHHYNQTETFPHTHDFWKPQWANAQGHFEWLKGDDESQPTEDHSFGPPKPSTLTARGYYWGHGPRPPFDTMRVT